MENSNVTPLVPKDKTEKDKSSLVSSLSPREIVSELDRFVVGQNKAKKAVAVALRNRWRRQALKGEMKNEVLPKNILMIGPTGVGKTEISRRLSKLAEAPFVKVEATRFTEVGYVGRDVEQIIRDLLEIAIAMEKVKKRKEDIIWNHYMYFFEKDEEIIELIIKTETQNKKHTTGNIPFYSVSKETKINFSVSPRVDKEEEIKGLVLAIEDITEVRKIKKTFKRYVSKQVVDELLDDDAKLNLGGEKREVTVLFSDIRGFTSMSEKMEPEQVVSTLNNYFSLMIDIVFKNNGTLDKIIGDELMIVFGAPTSSSDDTERAVKTAIEMQNKIKEFNKQRVIKKEIPIEVGIGINKGLVVSGNIGSRELMDYTVIGDTVNLGARLCSAAGPNEIITSSSVWFKTKNIYSYKKLEPIKVKGKKDEIQVYKIQK